MQAKGVIQTVKGTGIGWCTWDDGTLVEFRIEPTKSGKRPARVRCPRCKRRLVPRTINLEPMETQFYPAYKIPIHKRRK